MIEWVLNNIEKSNKRFMNFIVVVEILQFLFQKKFNKVLATEISKTSIKSALKLC